MKPQVAFDAEDKRTAALKDIAKGQLATENCVDGCGQPSRVLPCWNSNLFRLRPTD